MIIRSEIIVDIHNVFDLLYSVAIVIVNYIGYFSHVLNTF